MAKMGTEFFWFYDVILAAVLAGLIFVGAKRGFIRMVLSLAAIIVSFVLALLISDGVASWIYDGFISKPLEQTISETVNDALGDNVVTQLGKVEMDKAKVNGKTLDKLMEQKPDNAGKITVDLSNVDLSKTGISKIDLSSIGLDSSEVDYSHINLGVVQIYENDVEKHGIENVLLTEVLAQNIKNSEVADSVNELIEQVAESVPALGLEGKTIEDIDNGMVNKIVISVVESSGNPGKAVLDNVAKPIVLVPVRTIVFIILFFLILIVLSVIIKATSIVNKLPLIGKLNSLLGGVLGLVEGLVILFIIVIVAHMATAVTNNTLIFLNEMTINKSFAFSWVYNFSFLDFLN